MQVIGVGQLYLTADILQIFRAQGAFDGPLCAYIHKYRSLDSTMGAGKLTPAGLPFCFFQFKHSYLTKYTWRRQN